MHNWNKNKDKCPESPNGKHVFVYTGIRERGKNRCESFQCKFCGKTNMFKASECDDREHGLGSTRY